MDYTLVNRKYQQDRIFPASNSQNRAICVLGVGSTKPFSVLMVDTMSDLELISKGQCFPRYRFERQSDVQYNLLNEAPDLVRIDNVTDTTLRTFRSHYGTNDITKDAIFDYIYGILHATAYRVRFANNLAKERPRIPFAPNFEAFASAGKRLAELHLGYESCPQYPLDLEFAGTGLPKPEHFRLGSKAMRFADEARSVLTVNEHVRLKQIPPQAHGYVVNGRTPLEWFIDRYRITKDKHSGIINDPNAWFEHAEDLIASIQRIVYLSVQSTQIVSFLPEAISADDPKATITKAFFEARAREASEAIANSPWEAEDQAFVDAITDWDNE